MKYIFFHELLNEHRVDHKSEVMSISYDVNISDEMWVITKLTTLIE